VEASLLGHIGKVIETMSLLSRSKFGLAKALFLFAVTILLFLSTSSPSQTRVAALGPSAAWAAGSPDETLNPPPTPKKSSARLIITAGNAADRPATPQYLNVTGRDLSARHLFGIVWRVYWATVRL
jgi:hypothetical protein